MLRRAIALFALVAVMVTVGASVRSSAAAQDPSAGSLQLLARTPWVTASNPVFELIVGAERAARVEATIHDELVGAGGRSRFRTQLAGGDLGPQIGPTYTFDDEGSGRWRLQVPVVEAPTASTDDATAAPLALPDVGVYPVSVRAVDENGRELGSMLTHLVRSPAPDTFPTLASVIVVAGPETTATRPDGSVQLDDRAEANTQAVASAADRVPEVPFLYAVTPETIDALGPVARTRLAESSLSVPDGPWAGLDLGAWLSDDDLSDPLDHQIDRGRDALDGAQLNRSTATVLREPVTATQRDVLTFAGADVLITESDLAVGLEAPAVGRLRPAQVAESEQSALVVDDALQAHLQTNDDSVLAVHHLLADLAVLFFDRPNDPRSAMVWVEEPESLGGDALEALLSGFGASGEIVAAAEPDDVLSSIEPSGTLSMARRPPPSLSDYANALAATVAQIRVWDSVLLADDDRAEVLEATLDATAATDVIDQADEWFARARAIVDAQLTGITIPEQQTVTLTEREAELPIRIDNDLGYEANVLLKLDSTRLEVPEQGPRGIPVQLVPGANDLRIPVRARASGSFPLDVSVSTPRGSRVLADARFSVRTTVLNGVGLALTAGSLLVLLVWWARHFRDGRRDRRLVELGDATPRHEPEGADH